MDQYFDGSRHELNDRGISYVLDTVLEELQHNGDRTFMFVEQARRLQTFMKLLSRLLMLFLQAFFQRWWRAQSDAIRDRVRSVIRSRQFDLTVNGGWCMHDEAAPHYTAMVDQTRLAIDS